VNQNGVIQQSSKPTYYSLLGLHPSASAIEIRRAYRELSKCYHPDTTSLPAALATAKFQQLNEAYATLSNPERRFSYDLKIGYLRFGVIQAPTDLNHPVSKSYDWSKSTYLDASDRPLSAGEIFALFILGLTLIGCLLLAIAIGLTRGEAAF
jgi:curved DNA-binding protein CbpA